MNFKEQLVESILETIDKKILVAQSEMKAAQASANEETKSSAGDKYETGRAMSQNERDMHAKKMTQLIEMKKSLLSIDFDTKHEVVKIGSMVRTESMVYLISVGLGIIELNDTKIAVISVGSPVGQALMGKKADEFLELQGKKQKILTLE